MANAVIHQLASSDGEQHPACSDEISVEYFEERKQAA